MPKTGALFFERSALRWQGLGIELQNGPRLRLQSCLRLSFDVGHKQTHRPGPQIDQAVREELTAL